MRFLIVTALLASTCGFTGVANAQSTQVEGRVDRLEREMRAVQRKVFPGGAGQTLEPQIVPELNTIVPGTPAGTPLVDLTARVAALESQQASLTGQIEQNQYRLRQLEDAFNAYKRSTDARLKALEDTATSVSSSGGVLGGGEFVEAAAPVPARPATPAAKPATPAATAPATTGRAQQVAAVVKPSSGDAAEDSYSYGFRLWQAKLYPEARKELEAFVAKYPNHRRASYAQNLLGRSYLDAGAPSLAAVAFYENYKKNPNGERAPDSLYYLAEALVKLKKPASEVCKVYGELTQLYGSKLSAEMTAGVARGRTAQKCK